MRLKEDTSSWHSSSIQRRDYRHNPEAAPGAKRPPAKKDTKKWCRGKVGVEHSYVEVSETLLSRLVIRTRKCSSCGKKDTSLHEVERL